MYVGIQTILMKWILLPADVIFTQPAVRAPSTFISWTLMCYSKLCSHLNTY